MFTSCFRWRFFPSGPDLAFRFLVDAGTAAGTATCAVRLLQSRITANLEVQGSPGVEDNK